MPTSASSIEIRDEDGATLGRWTRASSVPAGLAIRARIVLGGADGEGTSGLSRRSEYRPTVIPWRERYAHRGHRRPCGRGPPQAAEVVGDAQVIARILEPPPVRLEVTHWSSRLLAKELEIGDATVENVFSRWGVGPDFTRCRQGFGDHMIVGSLVPGRSASASTRTAAVEHDRPESGGSR